MQGEREKKRQRQSAQRKSLAVGSYEVADIQLLEAGAAGAVADISDVPARFSAFRCKKPVFSAPQRKAQNRR